MTRSGPSGRSSDDCHVYRAFLNAVHVEKCVRLVVVQGCDLAAAQAKSHSRKGDILSDVAGVEVDVAIGPLPILPRAAPKHSRPNEDDTGSQSHLLVERSSGDAQPEITGPDLIELVPRNAIVIQSRFDPLDGVNDEVRLDWEEATGRGGRAERVSLAAQGDALGRPQEL